MSVPLISVSLKDVKTNESLANLRLPYYASGNGSMGGVSHSLFDLSSHLDFVCKAWMRFFLYRQCVDIFFF